MSESKGKILFVILAVLLLLFGGGTILYPSLNGLWVERTMHRDSEDFLLLLEEDAERTAEENSHVIPGDPGTRETAEPQIPLDHTQLWLDMKKNCKTVRYGRRYDAGCGIYGDACLCCRRQCVRGHRGHMVCCSGSDQGHRQQCGVPGDRYDSGGSAVRQDCNSVYGL